MKLLWHNRAIFSVFWKKRARMSAVAAIAFCCVIPAVSSGQGAGSGTSRQNRGGSDPAAESFLDRLHRSVENQDRPSVAELIQYPITILVSGFQVPVPNAAALMKLYDAVFTPELVDVIMQSDVPRGGKPRPKYA